jgi:hypothetical protein
MSNTPNVRPYIVEASFGDRHHEITTPDNQGQFLQVNTDSEIWIKENLINLGEQRLLPRNWKYISWSDVDIEFRDQRWALETMHELQHVPVLQPWRDSVDIGPTGGIMNHRRSFGYCDWNGGNQWPPKNNNPSGAGGYGHTGYVWAATREWWEQSRGLIDFGILGAGDWYMAWAMVGKVGQILHKGTSDSFRRLCEEWQERTLRITKGHVGFIPGRIEHHFHGTTANRKYHDRHDTLAKHDFDPVKDLVRDAQGLVKLCNKPQLEYDIRHYNRARQEDTIEEK